MRTALLSAWLVVSFVLIYMVLHKEPLTYAERRNIAIDFMANGSWRYTLCNMPMDSIRKEKK